MATLSEAHTTSTPALLVSPFRPFFLLTALYAILVMLAWWGFLFSGIRAIPASVNPAHWHAHEMLLGVLPGAITGFLLTAMPNWTGATALRGGALISLVAIWAAGRFGMWLRAMLPMTPRG